ncbi:uncharacterized protein LOC105172966 [Sesamum indicum]|uniref:Uncharacterized protein LOC105172966 n=1 Tax=Sesamum indicum TaxID=4182 RepID=A0A6I9UFB2_SESIN|nr:uncharacterized protein LOC105172966 [Sesamum indicum]
MSLGYEDRRSLDNGSEKLDVVLTKRKIYYSRDFLLSLSNLDICKKLPSGFDESLISEFEDALLRLPDRPRIPGSLPVHGFRRIEYGSSPPTRGGSGSYPRGTSGKWGSRSSGRSDRDSDSQSDRESDSGRCYGHQSRRSWQTPEHDGLLGSGSFPRPSGYAAGISAAKVQANEHHQLGRSSEPYHPPRPYKAVPHSRRDTDAYNDETFGSVECTSEDRAEEERRRRASFEMMRKEQQKALQEKQRLHLEKHESGGVSDLCEVLVNSKEENSVNNDEMEVSAAAPILSNDLEKSSFVSHSPSSRPLVPPGFKSNTLDKSSVLKSLIHPSLSEVQKPVKGKRLVDAGQNLDQNTNNGAERQLSQEISVVDSQPPEKAQHGLFLSKGGNVGLDVSLDVPIKKKPGMEDQLLRLSGHLDSHGTLDDPEIAELNATRVFNDKSVRDSDRSHSTSVLEKILGSTLSVNDGHASSAEHHDSKPDGTWSPNSVQSSKFAQWFFEEEAKVPGVVSSTSPNGLLSLIVSGDKADGVSDQACINNKEEGIPTVLTCEDLEQSILSEYHAKTTNVQPCLRNWGTTSTNTNQPSTRADDHASLQLLSMLQKSTDQNTTTVSSDVDINLADKQPSSQENDLPAVANKAQGEENNKVIPNLGKTLTLETLFGTAFMKELQSVEAPVSVQKGSIGTAEVDAPDPHGLPLPITNNDIASSTPDETGFQRPGHDFSAPSNHRQRTKLGKAESWHGSEDSTIGITTSKLHTEAVPKHCGLERVVEFQLPEEENLMSAGGTQDKRMLAFMPTGNSITNINLSSDIPINLSDKLAALGAFVKDKRRIEGLETLPFARNSYEQMEPEIAYGNVQVQHSSPLFQPQMTKVRQPPYPHLEPHHAHMNSRMKFLGPEPINNHDSPANHQFSSSMIRPPFHHPNVRIAGFDVPSQQSMLHQMQISGNNPPHMLPDFPRGGPVSQHSNQATGFIQEMNQMQGFPFGPRQPTMGSRGAPIPANPPEALQRFIEVELRANSRQIHPFAPGHSQGMYGHEVDMGLRYR